MNPSPILSFKKNPALIIWCAIALLITAALPLIHCLYSGAGFLSTLPRIDDTAAAESIVHPSLGQSRIWIGILGRVAILSLIFTLLYILMALDGALGLRMGPIERWIVLGHWVLIGSLFQIEASRLLGWTLVDQFQASTGIHFAGHLGAFLGQFVPYWVFWGAILHALVFEAERAIPAQSLQKGVETSPDVMKARRRRYWRLVLWLWPIALIGTFGIDLNPSAWFSSPPHHDVGPLGFWILFGGIPNPGNAAPGNAVESLLSSPSSLVLIQSSWKAILWIIPLIALTALISTMILHHYLENRFQSPIPPSSSTAIPEAPVSPGIPDHPYSPNPPNASGSPGNYPGYPNPPYYPPNPNYPGYPYSSYYPSNPNYPGYPGGHPSPRKDPRRFIGARNFGIQFITLNLVLLLLFGGPTMGLVLIWNRAIGGEFDYAFSPTTSMEHVWRVFTDASIIPTIEAFIQTATATLGFSIIGLYLARRRASPSLPDSPPASLPSSHPHSLPTSLSVSPPVPSTASLPYSLPTSLPTSLPISSIPPQGAPFSIINRLFYSLLIAAAFWPFGWRMANAFSSLSTSSPPSLRLLEELARWAPTSLVLFPLALAILDPRRRGWILILIAASLTITWIQFEPVCLNAFLGNHYPIRLLEGSRVFLAADSVGGDRTAGIGMSALILTMISAAIMAPIWLLAMIFWPKSPPPTNPENGSRNPGHP